MEKLPWPHAPLHELSAAGTYIVTAGTYLKEHFFRSGHRLEVLHRGLLTVTHDFGWQLEAWSIFSNHYHFVAHSPLTESNAKSLSVMLGLLHERTAKWVNRLDAKSGRKVWHNFLGNATDFPKVVFGATEYVHQNPVKHGLVAVANQYPWCSARWFERVARPAQVKTIYSLKVDKLKIYDEYEGNDEW
jgi:putative transposase